MNIALHAVYPGVLIISLACLAWIDYGLQLAFWRNRRRATVTLLASIVYFIVWDGFGIGLSIFYAGSSTYRSGLMLGPSFPVEELLFLTLLCYTVLLAWSYRSHQK